MTSQIVSATIDENYPVAGQDNDSQGFRNNFSIIKDGLATANSEITNLQLTSPKLNVANNFNGTLIDNAQTNRLFGTVFSITQTTGTTVVDYANGEYQIIGVGGNHSLRFTGFPQAESGNGKYSKIRLELKPVGTVPSQGWNVSLLAAGGGSVTGTVGFDQVGENPVINIGNDPTLATVIEAWTTNGLDFFVGLVGAYNAELNLESLTDVTLSTLSTGQILTYNGTSWVNGTVTVDIGSISSLEAVGDVSYDDLAAGDILKWNGTVWSGANDPTVTELDDIPDVDVASAVSGSLLRYNGTNWVGDTLDLNDLTDVVIDTLNTNHVLKYNGANWINTALMLGELGNVTSSSPVEGDILRYDIDGSTWKNEKDPNLHIYAVTLPPVYDGDDGYILDGSEIVDGLLTFHVGNIYRFNLSDSRNAESVLRFSTAADGSQPYTTNVRTFGTAGQPGSYIEIQITKDTPNPIYIYGGAGTSGAGPFPLGQNVPIPVIKTAFYTGSEDLASAAAASLIRSTSYFSTAAAETATLAAGSEGQVKVFAMYADTGDMVITVASPAWGGAGTITFDTVGQACTLQYINGKWFCIGNNGAAFA